jgi:hypothetical protein
MRLGAIARMDQGGLSWQTLAITRMLTPARVMVVDSRPFNGSSVKQFPERFDGYDQMRVEGFPTDTQCHQFLDGLTHVLTCETPYNYELLAEAERRGIKTFLQFNFEFLDALSRPEVPLPTMFLAPSTWHIDVMEQRFPGRVTLLPPPTFPEDFERARKTNLNRTGKRRFLHIIGKPAFGDRNGTMLLMHAMQRSRGSFELVVKCQQRIEPLLKDRRIVWDFSAPDEQQALYEDFDALIMPRRYGGLCLPMNEALTSALPVIMSDISPNNDVLPPEWLVPGRFKGGFTSRTAIQYFETDVVALARKLDELSVIPNEALGSLRVWALLRSKMFAPATLRPEYEAVMSGQQS